MEIASTLLFYTAILGFILGFVVNKTNFCTMGAVSDLVNIGDDHKDYFGIWSGGYFFPFMKSSELKF